MNYFQKQGRALLGNGYLIIPIKPGHKRPAMSGWQSARLGAADLAQYKNHGVGVLCGQGAHPIAAIDIDTTDEVLSAKFVEWCAENLGLTCERVGKAPKILLPYRAAEAGWGKALSSSWSAEWVQNPANGRWYSEGFKEVEINGKTGFGSVGQIHRVEVLGRGQQFVAYHIHPDTGQPYEWVDFIGGLEAMRADALPVITEAQVRQALRAFDEIAATCTHLQEHPSSTSLVPTAPARERTPADEEDFYGRVNDAALVSLSTWVPALFPAAREYQGGYRVASADLGRDLEEDLSIVPEGIVDFGVADMGDERQGKRSPIDLVLEWAPFAFDDPLDAPMGAYDAALWLCEQMAVTKDSLGFGLRRSRELAAERSARRMGFEALAQKVGACDDSIVLQSDLARDARELLAETPAFFTEVKGLFANRFKELTGLGLRATELDKLFREPKQATVLTHRPLTEFGNAARMLDAHGDSLMFVPELGSWFSWTGVYWRICTDIELEHFAKETVNGFAQEVKEHPDTAAFLEWWAMSQRAIMVKNMVRLAQSDPRVLVPARELDKHSRYLGASNGVIDLVTGELLPPDPELRITRTVGCDYVPDAPAPLWEQTVSDVFSNDAETVGFFQRLVGYAAMGNPNQDVMVIPYGNGSNGKSTVLGVIRKALGGYARSAEASTFVSDGKGGASAGGAREDLLRLKGARFVYVNEPDENSELREGAVKSMTGGDAITARGLYNKNTVEILPSWVVFMPTNHKPIVKGSDNGIWRRLMLLPFERNFEGMQKDPHREAKLEKELEGVLAWIVKGAIAYQKEGLKPVGVVKQAVDDYRADMDLLAEWLEQCCEFDPHYSEDAKTLFTSWKAFAEERGIFQYVRTSVQLGRRLESRFPSRKASGGVRVKVGLRVKSDF